MPSRSPEGDALTALVLPAFELNGEFLAAAEMITAPRELTPACLLYTSPSPRDRG